MVYEDYSEDSRACEAYCGSESSPAGERAVRPGPSAEGLEYRGRVHLIYSAFGRFDGFQSFGSFREAVGWGGAAIGER